MSTADKSNYLLETKNQIKNAIEGKGVSIQATDSFRSYASKIEQIEGGGTTDIFWDLRTNGGTNGEGLFAYTPLETCNNTKFVNFIKNMNTSKMKSFKQMFQSSNFTELDFGKWNMSEVESMNNMFFSSKFTKIDFSNCNLNKVTNLNSTFYNCQNLTEINLLNCDTSKAIDIYGLVYSCKNLIKILGVLDLFRVTSLSSSFGYNASSSPTLLEEVRIKNLNYTGLNLQYCTALSHDSLIYLINNLVETRTAKTLNLGATNLAKLTDEEKAIATEKGWTLA